LSNLKLLKTIHKDVVEFFRDLSTHECDQMRMVAVYNLPCIHLLFSDDIDIGESYLGFLNDEDENVRKAAAGCLHESFKLLKDDEDTSKFRECFIDLAT
jgi:hypothetical protein